MNKIFCDEMVIYCAGLCAGWGHLNTDFLNCHEEAVHEAKRRDRMEDAMTAVALRNAAVGASMRKGLNVTYDLSPWVLGYAHVSHVLRVLTKWEHASDLGGLVVTAFTPGIPREMQQSFIECMTKPRPTLSIRYRNDNTSGATTKLVALPIPACEALAVDVGRLGLLWLLPHFVEHLCLRQGPISDPASLSAALTNNVRLRRLELQGMALGEEGGVVLTTGLQNNTCLTYLNISSNGLGAYRHILKPLSEALFHHPALTFLDLSRNEIEESAVVGEQVGHSMTITTLKLQQNKLRGDGVKGLVDGLSMNLRLEELDVGRNDMPTTEALQLLQAVKLSNVQDLNLQDNLVGEQGAEGMAKMLMVESRAKRLRTPIQKYF